MSKPVLECTVDADLFRRALKGVSTEETRYYLNGVHISAAPGGGAILVATNGSFLIAIRDPGAIVKGSGIVQLSKAMVSSLKTPKRSMKLRLLTLRGGAAAKEQRAAIVDIEGAEGSPYEAASKIIDAPDNRVQQTQFGDVLIDGTFPNWRGVLPSGANPSPDPAMPVPVLDLVLLARAAEALSHDSHSLQTLLTASGPNSPVLVTCAGASGIDGFAIVMPVRVTSRPGVIPPWAMSEGKSPVAKAA